MTDFESLFTNLVIAPGYIRAEPSEDHLVWSLEQRVDAFYQSYSVWIFAFAEKLVQMPDSGFAVLSILNAYPEMIAQLHGEKGKKLALFQFGMLQIFPELQNEPEVNNICEHIYGQLRSGMAHMGLTGINIILTEDIPAPILPGKYRGSLAVAINPRLWFERTQEHFKIYISQLCNPQNRTLRDKFLERINQPF